MSGARRTAIITGASSGIGAETARLLAAKGWRVVLVARSADKLDALARELGDGALAEPLDTSDGAAVLASKARLDEIVGTPDAIVNAAGAGRWLRVEETAPDEAAAMIGAPYLSALHMTHAYMADFLARGSGTTIMINSPAVITPWPRSAGYAASRWALRGLHEALSQDLAGTGVRSCHVVFGKVETSYFDNNPGAREALPGISRMIRTLTPEDCAEVILSVAERPRLEVIYPRMLAFMAFNARLFPRLSAWLVRRTSPSRTGSGTA